MSTKEINEKVNTMTEEFDYPLVEISARKNQIESLLEKLASKFPTEEIELTLQSNPYLMKMRSFIFDNSRVIDERFDDSILYIKFHSRYPRSYFVKRAKRLDIEIIN